MRIKLVRKVLLHALSSMKDWWTFQKLKNCYTLLKLVSYQITERPDHILTLKTLDDKYVNQNNGKIYACFIDFKKAFDSIWHASLSLKLLENGIGGCFYDLIKDLYSNTRCAVKVSGHRTPFFSYNRGVRQGYVLSPLLFNLYINELPNLFEKVNAHAPISFTKWNETK